MSIEPFKIVGQLIAVEKDQAGEIIAEIPVGDLVIYAARFDQLAEQIAERWPEVTAAIESARQGTLTPH